MTCLVQFLFPCYSYPFLFPCYSYQFLFPYYSYHFLFPCYSYHLPFVASWSIESTASSLHAHHTQGWPKLYENTAHLIAPNIRYRIQKFLTASVSVYMRFSTELVRNLAIFHHIWTVFTNGTPQIRVNPQQKHSFLLFLVKLYFLAPLITEHFLCFPFLNACICNL